MFKISYVQSCDPLYVYDANNIFGRAMVSRSRPLTLNSSPSPGVSVQV